jgi:hypothetical protein
MDLQNELRETKRDPLDHFTLLGNVWCELMKWLISKRKEEEKMLTMTIYLLSKYIEEVATCPYSRTKKGRNIPVQLIHVCFSW